jgi:hypothetical protein
MVPVKNERSMTCHLSNGVFPGLYFESIGLW